MTLPPDVHGVLFDMDGVLVDSEQQWKRLSKTEFETHIPGWGEADFKRIVGLGVEDLYKLLKKEYGYKLTFQEALDAWEGIAQQVYRKEVRLAEGVHERLGELAARGVPAAIVSSSPHRWIKLVVERFELGPRFKKLFSAQDVGGLGKPDPAVYLHAIAQLGLDPARSVAIEDSTHGLNAAKAAGLRVVAYRNGFNHDQDLSAADWEISNFRQAKFS